MKQKRRKGGVLTGLVKYQKSPSPRKKSILEKIGTWVLGAVIAAVLLVMLVTSLVRMFHPQTEFPEKEGDFIVLQVKENPPGYPPEKKVVAAAYVVIERCDVAVPLTQESRRGVEPDKLLHIRYKFFPLSREVEVKEWKLKS